MPWKKKFFWASLSKWFMMDAYILHIYAFFKMRITVEDKCVPHCKYCCCLNSVEPSGNDLLICGNPTQPASLVTTTTSKPTLSSPALLNSQKNNTSCYSSRLVCNLPVGTSWNEAQRFRIPWLICVLQNTIRNTLGLTWKWLGITFGSSA